MKATLLIAIGILWLSALAILVWWLLHSFSAVGWGVDMPLRAPRWVAYGVLVTIAAVFWLGWIVPLTIGIRSLTRRD
jgi:hypothetical protein